MAYQYRYRLPSTAGGAEYNGVVNGDFVLLDIPGTGVVPLPSSMVTRIVPEEPEEGSFVAVLKPEEDTPPLVWVRLARTGAHIAEDLHWWSYDRMCWCTWEEIYSLGNPRLLTFGGKILRQAGARGYCGRCEQTRPLRADGKFRLHGTGYDRCPGSQKRPEDTVKRGS